MGMAAGPGPPGRRGSWHMCPHMFGNLRLFRYVELA